MTLATVSASDLRSGLADALESANGKNIVIVTRRGRRERAIIDIDQLEDLLAASNPDYLAEIKEARRSKEYFSHQDVFGDL